LRWKIETAVDLEEPLSISGTEEERNIHQQKQSKAGSDEDESEEELEEYQDYEDLSSHVESTAAATTRTRRAMNGGNYQDDIDLMFGSV
jgi:hypothetical protein